MSIEDRIVEEVGHMVGQKDFDVVGFIGVAVYKDKKGNLVSSMVLEEHMDFLFIRNDAEDRAVSKVGEEVGNIMIQMINRNGK